MSAQVVYRKPRATYHPAEHIQSQFLEYLGIDPDEFDALDPELADVFIIETLADSVETAMVD